MQSNNEIGNILDIEKVGELCEQYNAYFHSDTVQSIGHYQHDLKKIKVHGMAASAHKFHGPKGIGFMFIRKEKKISPILYGGSQERNMRGGTENVYGIIGLTKALEITYRDMDAHTTHIKGLKSRMIEKLTESIPGITFNGDSADLNKSLYTVLSVSLPESEENDMILFNLDLQGISASGGSACSSGATLGSHVLAAINPESKRGAIRFSFSKFNTIEEIDRAVEKLKEFTPIPSRH
jgi:cysteine desulfurase